MRRENSKTAKMERKEMFGVRMMEQWRCETERQCGEENEQ